MYYSKPREKLTWGEGGKHLLICSYFWDTRTNTLVGNMEEMLLFRFENNVWAGYSLFSEPRHVNEQGLHYDTSVSGP